MPGFEALRPEFDAVRPPKPCRRHSRHCPAPRARAPARSRRTRRSSSSGSICPRSVCCRRTKSSDSTCGCCAERPGSGTAAWSSSRILPRHLDGPGPWSGTRNGWVSRSAHSTPPSSRRWPVNVIDICTPPSSHAEYSASGIGHGLHVLCEKPVFLPGEDGYASQLRVIRASDRVFYPCHVYKYAPVLAAMKERIAAPAFGEVAGAHFRTLRAGHAKGRRPSGRLLRGRPPAVGPRGRSADRPGGGRVGGGCPRGTTRRRADARLRARPRRRAARAGRCGVTAPQEPAAVAARRRESVPGAENQWRATEDDRTVAGDD